MTHFRIYCSVDFLTASEHFSERRGKNEFPEVYLSSIVL